MKVKVLKDFRDKYTGERHNKDDILTVSKARFEEILTVDKLVEEVVEEAAENVAEEAAEPPKKTGRKSSKKSAE